MQRISWSISNPPTEKRTFRTPLSDTGTLIVSSGGSRIKFLKQLDTGRNRGSLARHKAERENRLVDLNSALDRDLPPEVLEEITSSLPCHRFGEPLEIGALCVYLSSPAGVQITGVHYNLDGGLLAVQ